MSEEIEVIQSELSGVVDHEGTSAEVIIFRSAGDEDWSVEIADQEGTTVVWADQFETDDLAHQELLNTLKEEGLAAILANSPE